jgi:transposase
MRKGFAGLSGLVRQHIDHDLMSGDVFIFINRRRDRIKLLMWDATGFVLYYKQLEQGTFEIPDSDQDAMELPWSDLVMLLEGIKFKSIQRRKRYQKAG